MTRIESKLHRLSQIEATLVDHPEGITRAELARRFCVHRSTILRNLADLTIPVYEEGDRIFIDRESYLINLRLNIHEIIFIHLAGRLMTSNIDRQNPHAASTLRKLSSAIEGLAPQISQFVKRSANTFDNGSKKQDPHYMQVLEVLTSGWARNQKIHLWYQSQETGPIKEYIFSPFFIEVGAFGQTIYVIGRLDPDGTYRTFKIDRVERIELLTEKYAIPENFNPDDLLNNAWGIWFTNQEPVTIELHFSSRVAQRVKETLWHPTQRLILQEDGSIIWQGEIAEPREMVPWIRGWGADVEVLQPESLREEMKNETIRFMNLYGIFKGSKENEK